jgi:cytidylate kinase
MRVCLRVKKRIVLPGPPASGKGTQAELIQKNFGLPATSTGAILRREAKLGTALGSDFYERRGILARVDANREAPVVFDELSRLITA